MYTNIELVDAHHCFGGQQLRFLHQSKVLGCAMHFSVYLPAQAQEHSVPVILWLSGLTCNDQNFVTKAGAQQFASDYGIAVVAPDTSPRGEGVPDDPDGAYDFGLGAGFYVNATQEPWAKHYQMYDYIVHELPALLATELPLDMDRLSISGHSMGGHGALTIALKNPDMFRSVSAFSPICAPSQCPWGEKALAGYLGPDKDNWLKHDTVALLKNTSARIPGLVDQGEVDEFLQGQLNTNLLEAVVEAVEYPMTVRRQAEYDHSYFFIASFIGEHIKFHAQYLN